MKTDFPQPFPPGEKQPARELWPGDAVEIAPGVIHWHGAYPESRFAHPAVACNAATNENTRYGAVDEERYAAATGPQAASAGIGCAQIADNPDSVH